MNKYCTILIYHRVIVLDNDPQLLAVTPENFEAQIIWLKRNYNIIPLRYLISLLKEKREIPEKSIVITFDDGYFDNLYFAKPILEKYKVYATIFVSSGYVGKNREFWWDELERLFLFNDKIVDKKITVSINDTNYEWSIKNLDDAQNLYRILHPLLKYLTHENREKILSSLFKQFGMNRDEVRDTHRILSAEELKRLSDSNYIEIGAHTVHHCVLSMESIPNQEVEINQSKETLETIIGKKIDSFSYPFGTDADYNENTIETLKRAGYAYAIANNYGVVRSNTDLYRIPRFLVRNWAVEKLKEELKKIESKEVNSQIQKKKQKFIFFIIKTLKHFSNKIKNIFSKIKFVKKIFFKTNKLFNKSLYHEISFLRNELQKNELYIKYKELKHYYYNNLLYPKLTANISLKFTPKDTFNSVLQINTSDKKGGAARVSYTLHQEYLKRDLKSYLLVSEISEEEDFIYKISRHLDFQQKLLYDLQNNESYQDFFHLSSFDIKDYYLFKKSDVLHLHNLHGNYFSFFALPELSSLKPTLWTLHDMQSFTGHCAHSFNCNRWMDKCGNCPDLSIYPSLKKDETKFIIENKKKIYEKSFLTIVCPSNWLKNKVEKSILKNHDIRLIYNGINTSIFKNKNKQLLRKKLNLPENQTILFFSASGGLNNPWKGSQYVIDAYKSICNQNNFLFVNLGGDSHFNKKNWIDIPYINDENLMSDYYAASDLFIYPSLADNCPLVVMEALSCGTPVITFRTGGVPELVQHLETGYVADYKNLDDFIRGILLFSQNKELQKKASIQAREHAVVHFDTNIMTNAYLKLYQEIVSKNMQLKI